LNLSKRFDDDCYNDNSILTYTTAKMATKFAFTQGLKELRFHLCQTSEHSAAAR
jgi:hypothetical protein